MEKNGIVINLNFIAFYYLSLLIWIYYYCLQLVGGKVDLKKNLEDHTDFGMKEFIKKCVNEGK